jgi:hypothetical protein
LAHTTHKISPLFTPISIAATVIFIVVFGLITITQGGFGFSPGPVTGKSLPGVTLAGFHSHADFESNCGLCHQPTQTDQAKLCMNCHKDIAAQIQSGNGLHARLDNVNGCASCHGEHKGRDFDPTGDALRTFNHNRTTFPLAGKHGQIQCTDCHTGGKYSTANPACATCHQDPVSHAGLFSSDCSSCHNTFNWNDVTLKGKPFNHGLTGFTLNLHASNYDKTPITCTACHTSDPSDPNQKTDLQTCVNCHGAHDQVFMTKHLAQYGTNCLTCHDGVDRLQGFTHARVFPLTGKHATIACTDCHKNNVFRSTPTACVSCHTEPQIHAGFFGTRCDYCHVATAWEPAPLRAHTFPLAHGVTSDSACKTCHTGSYAQYTCYGCHDHTPQGIAMSHAKLNLTQAQLAACTDCHMDGKVARTTQ